MPNLPARPLLIATFVLLLSACGGGGGGGGDSSPPQSGDNSWLSFAPRELDADAYADEARVLRVTATSSRTIDGVINVGIIDTRGVLDPNRTVVRALSALSYEAEMRLATTLSAGTYTGSVEVRLCRDNPVTCAQPIAGSPWLVPYRFVVRAAVNLTPLAPLAGAGAWGTYQGNAAHTGYVDSQVQPAQFSRRWAVALEAGSLAVDGGRVVTAPPSNRSGAIVTLAEHDGAELWRYGGQEFYSGAGVGGGQVWFMNRPYTDFAGTFLRSLDLASGAPGPWRELSQFNQSPRYAPVVDGGAVFIASDRANTIARHRASDAAEQWRALFDYPYAQPALRWTPALADGRAVMFDYQTLWIADAATGALQGSIAGPNSRNGQSGTWEVFGAPVLGPGARAYVSAYYSGNGTAYDSGRLAAFDLANRSLLWHTGTTVRSNPVLVGNVLYVQVTGGALQAHDAATGALLWRWDAPLPPTSGGSNPPPPPPPPSASGSGGPDRPLVVVGNIAFVGLDDTTHAVNLTTRQSVWQYAASGPMAVSANGVLYIAAPTRLHAINLR
jgi:outer membrane protein assembly factor BamB